tara:strand:+ start:8291 stop:8767 length:477 start_codon:yes stop_codon:yes gene_type:complete
MVKVGIGKDSHKFGSNKPLILGGIEIPSEQGFESHSDGDVVLHALFNAISSALGGGSIGYYYPNNNPSNYNKASKEFFEKIYELLKQNDYKVYNISITIEAKQPKLEPHFPNMRKSIADICETDINSVGITATTGEGLTAFGKGEGIQAIAMVSLIQC